MAELVISIVTSIVTSVVSEIGKLLVKVTRREGRYLFCGAKITKEFESAKEEMMKTQKEVQELVEDLSEVEIADDAVVKWLDEVNNLLTEVKKLEEEINAKGSCFRWCCLHGLYKQMAPKTERMINLSMDGKFDTISKPSTGKFMNFKSTKLALDQLLEALGDSSSRVIGLFGMGGSGKTTLATEVRKQAKKLKLFGRVAFITVSQAPTDVRKIQQEIGGYLDLKFEDCESEGDRAEKICMKLQSKERTLVILDDVWRKIDIEKIGLFVNGKHNSFKVLLTTRRLEVCNLMDCQKKIPLQLLSEDDAWTLFMKYAGLDDKHLKLLNGKAQEVARECERLHIAIEAMGTSLKGKPIDDWDVALDRLKNSEPIDVEEGVPNAFACLKLSYDFLRSEEARLLFLMCSMFPEDHDISVEDLFRYRMGLGVRREGKSFEIERSELKKDINYLINSCLLMRSENEGDHVKMHDVVRDVALWIASNENRTIIVNYSEELEIASTEECFAITSWHGEIAQFPKQLYAPKLEILLVNSSYLELSSASFEGIKGLKVIGIIQNYFISQMVRRLPQFILGFTNLRFLQLVGSKLGDISFVSSLKMLEILDLKESKFKRLPCGLQNLDKLKLLDLSECQSDENCYEVLKECLQLEELYVASYFSSSSEIIDFESFYLDNMTFTKLQTYILKVGECYKVENFISSSKRALYIGKLNISISGATIKNLIQRATKVFLESLEGCKSVVPEMVEVIGGMSELIELCIVSSSEIECLFSTTSSKAKSFEEDTSLSNLVKLTLHEMNNLIELCCNPSLLCIFQNLENVTISNCNQLKSLFPRECNLCNLKYLSIKGCPKLMRLFSMSMAQTLHLLQELYIEHCSELKHIMANGEGGGNRRQEILVVSENSHLGFSQLKKVYVEDCHMLEYIFPFSVVQNLVQLEEVRLTSGSALKYVFGKHDGEFCSSYQEEIQIVLPQLKKIKLRRLCNLVTIVPESYNISWPSLIKFLCVDCPQLTSLSWSIINMVGTKQRQLHLNMGSEAYETCGSQLSNEVLRLQKLELLFLPELSLIWMGSTHFLSLQYLEKLKICGCDKLKSVFSTVIRESLPLLRKLEISCCDEMEEIIVENEDPQNLSNARVCFPKLEVLKVVWCDKLKSLFSTTIAKMLPQLNFLYISDCAQLENIFKCENIEDSCINNRNEFMVPNLKKLILEELPELVDIGQGFTLHAVELNSVKIYECPKFTPILGASSVHQSQEVLTNGLVSREFSALQAILNVKMQFPTNEEQRLIMAANLIELCLIELPDLLFIWKGPTLISFQFLRDLNVAKCNKLRSIFSIAVIRSLPLLEKLYIANCEELEEIISVGEGEELDLPNPSNSRSQQPCFPTLSDLTVGGCDKLKCVFPISISGDLPCLRKLKIRWCSQLEQVFGCVPENHDVEMMELELQNLEELTLKELPSLTNICRGFESQLQLKALYACRVNDCPNFHSTTIPALHESIISPPSDDSDD